METFCSYFNHGKCRSCDLIKKNYSDQILFKEMKLKEVFKDYLLPDLLPTIQSQSTHFRNKAKFIISGEVQNPIIGIYGEDNLDNGIDLTECALHLKEIAEMIPKIKSFITKSNLTPYHVQSKKGELKGIILFYSESSRESYLRFILRSKEPIDRIRKFQKDLLNEISHLKMLSVNIQPIPHAILEGEEEIFITDKKSISHRLENFQFQLTPRAFVQTNQKIAEKLYSTAAQWIKESHLSRMVELYCGQGAFSFFASPYLKDSLGIEINPDAVKVANEISTNHKLHHLKFVTSDAAKVSEEVRLFKPEIILVNPPRRGLGEAVHILKKERPPKIIYSSCQIETLGEDFKILEQDYEIKRIQIFDMFPNTNHFETLVQLNLKSN